MGNGPSSRRSGRIQHNPVQPPPLPPPRMVPPPSGYPGNHAPHPGPGPYPPNGHHPPYFFPQNYNGAMIAPMGPQFYQSGYIPSNGQYMMRYNPSTPLPPPMQPAPPPVATETQKANTIRNDVNLKKSSLRLVMDEENPGCHLVAFSFDATVGGSISIFVLAREIQQCGFVPLDTQLFKVVRIPFEKGLCQNFRQAPGTGVDLGMFDERDLSKEGDDEVYPLVVRTETIAKDAPANVQFASIDEPLPKWVQCQTTQAVIERRDDGEFKVRVVRQNILIDGIKYELKEIYGIENHGGDAGYEEGDEGKECVICMSEPRDTFVLPCRHMCMCNECANLLKTQTNRCPICRTPVDKLLQIEVSKTENFEQGSGAFEFPILGSASPSHSHTGQSSSNGPEKYSGGGCAEVAVEKGSA